MMHQGIISVDAMMQGMRTTVTLDPDVAQIVRRMMREREISFKEAINEAIRRSVRPSEPFRTVPASMGTPRVNLDRALRLVGELEDDDLIRKMRSGS